MTPEQAYETYVAVKAHFEGKYDYFQYRGRVKNADLSKRNDKYKFVKLAKQEDIPLFLAANFVRKPNEWIGSMVDNEAGRDCYLEAKKFVTSASYILENDLRALRDDSLQTNLFTHVGGRPVIFSDLRDKRVCVETVALLNRVYKFIDIGDKILDPLYEKKSKRIAKYGDFLEVPNSLVLEKVRQIFPTGRRK